MATTTDFDCLYKILLIGSVRVGKTSFLTRYIKNVMSKNQAPTLGVEYQTKCIILKTGTVVKAQIWDTSGSEKYKSITTAHYRKSVGALLFYDITDRSTFEDTADWLREIHDHTEEGIVIMLVGNKSDLVEEDPSARKVSIEEATEFSKKYNLLFMETSAKTGHNVKEAFEALVETVYEEQKKRQGDQFNEPWNNNQSVRVTVGKSGQSNSQSQQKSDSCCGF